MAQTRKPNNVKPKSSANSAQGTRAVKAAESKPKPRTRKTSAKKSTAAKKDDFVKQNMIALFLLIFGMVFLISITTNALGPIGLLIKSMLLGQLAKVSIFISIAMILVIQRIAQVRLSLTII